ncbi:type II secretion system protein N [Vibrio hippocampi]|uniref:Type II secretion system protein N n=1 Tax=Vibrio hippocampi TaxID=654686 RepID=A0ABM8ZDP2_9VIBR|nr:type II secretion system protein N [Vibrio hippocampi]CAH0524378.1 Type II secretion system protein N [Vibrio hippocampi]
MKRVISYVAVFSTVFIGSAIYHAPANVVLSYAPVPDFIDIKGVEGTIWQGRAQQVQYENWSLGEVGWNFDWMSVIKLSPEFALRFGRGSAMGLSGKGNVGISTSGPYVSTVVASIPADQAMQLAPALPLPITVGGRLELAIKSATYQSPWCSQGEGNLAWNEGLAETPLGSLSFGPTMIDFECDQSTISATGTQNSPQVMGGMTAQLTPNRQYQTEAWFKPGSQFPTGMSQQLSWLGNPDNQGRYSFTYQGKL